MGAARAEGRKGAWSDIIGSRTSHLLASVAANHPGGVVYDPACGIASALIELADTSQFDDYIGHDINDRALAIAPARRTGSRCATTSSVVRGTVVCDEITTSAPSL